MTVYVDDLYMSELGKFRRMKMSHLIADSDSELHLFATDLGLKRSWFQGDHYDVSMEKRTEAIRRGAVHITLRQCAMMVRMKKEVGVMPLAHEAERVYREHFAQRWIR